MPNRSRWFLCVLLLALGLAGAMPWWLPAGHAAAPPTVTPVTLRDMRWRPEGENLIVELGLSAAPTMKVQDSLLKKRYVCLDFYNAEPPPADGTSDPAAQEPRAAASYGQTPTADFKIASPLIHHIKRIHYGPQRVLRFVFYARTDLRYTVAQTPAHTVRITFSPITPRALSQRPGQPAGPSSRKRVVIDPGHGGTTADPVNATGAETSERIDGKTYYEKELTLQMAQRLKRLVDQSPNMQAFLTRTGDYAVTLPKRIELANQSQGDLFVSIHLNATDARSKTARGFEIFYLDDTSKATNKLLLALENDENIHLSSETSGNDTLRDILRGLADDNLRQRQAESADLAAIINEQFLREGPFRQYHRGVKGAAFRVLMNYQMPAVLLEAGFIDNPDEARELVKANVQERIAALIFNGINRYFAREDPNFRPYMAKVQ
jgi:N-acetylmuramoyl-L-alanine amidase